MFLLDDILFAPANGLFAIFRELHKAVEQESVNEAESVRAELSRLYMLLETGQVSEEEFDAAERPLLDRLDELEAPDADAAEEDGVDPEDEDEEDEDEEWEDEDEEEEDRMEHLSGNPGPG